jgi:hypothetical protein
VPEVSGDDRTYDLREYFYERHRVLMLLLAMALVLMFVSEWLLIGSSDWRPHHLVRGIALAAVLLGAVSERPWVQAAIVFVILALLLFGLSWLDDPIA